MFKILLLFCVLLINSKELNIIQKTIAADEEKDIFSQIQKFNLLTEFERKEFIRLCDLNNYSIDDLFHKVEDVKRFLVCNAFCKNFIFNDIGFDEYRDAIKFLAENKIDEIQSLECYILWNSFFKKRFNKNISSEEYKRYFKIAFQCRIYSYDDFSDLIEWNNCYNKIFDKDISIEQVKAIRSFLDFFKSKNLILTSEENSKIVYVFLFIGYAKIWKIQKLLEDDDLNLEKFKTILTIIYSWKGDFDVNWIQKLDLQNLLKANDLFLKNKKVLTYSDFESLYVRLQSCPNMSVDQLLNQTKDVNNKEVILNKSETKKKTNNQKKDLYVKKRKLHDFKTFNINIIEGNKDESHEKVNYSIIELKKEKCDDIIEIARKNTPIKKKLEDSNNGQIKEQDVKIFETELKKDNKKIVCLSLKTLVKTFFTLILTGIVIL